MSDSIPTNPTPTAVPWTPDMMTPDMPLPAHAQNAAALQPQMHEAPLQTAPQYHAPQSEYTQPAAPHIPQSYAPPTQVQPTPADMQHPQIHHAAYAPAVQSQYPTTPQHAPALQPVHHMQQPAPHQMVSAVGVLSQIPGERRSQMAGQMTGQPQYAQPQQPRYAQSGPPPLAVVPQTTAGAQLEPSPEPKASKSLLANLLKRSPKPEPSEANTLPARSDSLFNKNFILGAVTGLLVGAFVLPMALNVLGGGSSAQAQTQAAPLASFNPAPAATNGDTFIDNAIATDAP